MDCCVPGIEDGFLSIVQRWINANNIYSKHKFYIIFILSAVEDLCVCVCVFSHLKCVESNGSFCRVLPSINDFDYYPKQNGK